MPGYIPPLLRPTGRSGEPFGGAGSFTSADGLPLTDPDPDPGAPIGSPLAEGYTQGPNKACPTPITPLTNVRATAQDSIDNLQSFYDSGTAIPMGAVWGWRVLSPGEPFTDGVPYTDNSVNKVMIIMTDGDNNIEPSTPLCKQTNPGRYTSDYTGYGYTSELRLGTSNAFDAADELNARLATVCQKIKDSGITIFTITFGDAADVTIQGYMRSCASLPANYFHAPTGDQLQTAFQAIGAQLTQLRIAK